MSDHALVRFLERVHGLDICKIRSDIANEALRRQVANKDSNTGIFNCKYQTQTIVALPDQKEKQCQVVMESGTIVTIQIKER